MSWRNDAIDRRRVSVVTQTNQLSFTHFIILALFFVSGAVGLAYEIVWVRQLSLFLGVSIYAVSAVLVAFMGGLGVGAELFGRLLDRGFSPVRLYSVLEISLAVYVLLFPVILDILKAVSVLAHGGQEGISLYIIFLRFALAVLALLIPTVLMGGTLPALVKYFSTITDKSHGSLAGSLYAVNTIGAMTGCIAAGFAMIEIFGLTGSLRIGASLNLFCGAAAWLIAGETVWKTDRPDDKTRQQKRKKQSPRQESLPLVFYAITGFCALALELLWTRTLSLLLNNTTYAFTLVLAVFLFGIAAGSAIVSRIRINSQEKNLYLFASAMIGIGVMALLSLVGMALNQSMVGIFSAVLGASGWVSDSFPGGAPMVSAILFSLIIVTPCTLIMGACFPLAIGTGAPGKERVAGRVGRYYAVNTIGSVAGSLAAGYFLIPMIGVQKSIVAISAVAMLGGLTLMFIKAPKRWFWTAVTTFILAVGPTAFIIYSPDIAYRLSSQKLDAGSEVEFYEEGPAATVLVSAQYTDLSVGRKPIKRIWINGDPIAGAFREALQLEKLQAHIPLLLHPDPENALVICFGTGSTVGAALTHGLKEVTALDISREVFHAAPFFKDGNLDVANSARVKMVEEDGRNFLLTTRRKFDFITAEPPPPSNAGIVSLYTKEFYELCKIRLAENGMVSQWIPIHHMSLDDIKSLVAAFVDVFPNSAMWYTKWDIIMIGSNKKIVIDSNSIAEKMNSPQVKASLAEIGVYNVDNLLSKYMMGPEGLRRFIGGAAPVTDDLPTVEFTAPRVQSRGVIIKGENLSAILKNREFPEVVFGSGEEMKKFKKYFVSQNYFYLGQVDRNNNNMARAAGHYDAALRVEQDNNDARYAYLSLNLVTLYAALDHKRSGLGLSMLKETEKLDKERLFSPQLKYLKGMFLVQAGKEVEGARKLEEAIRLDSDYFMAIVNLAGLYNTKLNRPKKARELYAQAIKTKSSKTEKRLVRKAMEKLPAVESMAIFNQ